MNRHGRSTIFRLSILLTVAISLFALVGESQALLYCNAGVSAQVQDENALVSPVIYYAYGMDFKIKDFSSTWVHIPVPLPYTTAQGVDYVQVEVSVAVPAGKVSEVVVYSSGTLLGKFNVNWVGDKTYSVKLSFGSVKTVYGPISISLKCESGDGSTRFLIRKACVNRKNK